MWIKVLNKMAPWPNCEIIQKTFTLDQTKVQNMQSLNQIVTFNGQCFGLIANVEPKKPNVIYYAAEFA